MPIHHPSNFFPPLALINHLSKIRGKNTSCEKIKIETKNHKIWQPWIFPVVQCGTEPRAMQRSSTELYKLVLFEKFPQFLWSMYPLRGLGTRNWLSDTRPVTGESYLTTTHILVNLRMASGRHGNVWSPWQRLFLMLLCGFVIMPVYRTLGFGSVVLSIVMFERISRYVDVILDIF